MTERKSGVVKRVRRAKVVPPALHEPDEEFIDDDPARVIERADGFHWLALDGRQEFGPFESRALALADMAAASERSASPLTTLHEVEREIGIADWIDPDTGEPAEGSRPPHLSEE